MYENLYFKIQTWFFKHFKQIYTANKITYIFLYIFSNKICLTVRVRQQFQAAVTLWISMECVNSKQLKGRTDKSTECPQQISAHHWSSNIYTKDLKKLVPSTRNNTLILDQVWTLKQTALFNSIFIMNVSENTEVQRPSKVKVGANKDYTEKRSNLFWH